jgi:hypothetical protein
MRKAVFVFALLGLSNLASAGLLANGSFGFSFILDCCTLDSNLTTGTGNIQTANTINWTDTDPFGGDVTVTSLDPTTFSQANVFFGITNFAGSAGEIDPDTVNTAGGDSLTLTFGPTAQFLFTSGSEQVTKSPVTHAVNYYFLGTFHDTTNTYDDAAASFTLTFTQSAPDSTITGGGTFSTPPAQNTFGTPEPATVALIGAALIGLAGMRRRKA